MRRRLFDGEIGVLVNDPEQMRILAEFLEIESDGDNSGADFVAYAIKRFDKELRARFHESRAQAIREHGASDE